MLINTSVLGEEERRRSYEPPPQQTQAGKFGFNVEQYDRLKKHEATPQFRAFLSMMVSLQAKGYNKEIISIVGGHMDINEISDKRIWSAVLPFIKKLDGATRGYYAYRAGFSLDELDAVNSMSLDSLRTMATMRSL